MWLIRTVKKVKFVLLFTVTQLKKIREHFNSKMQSNVHISVQTVRNRLQEAGMRI